MLSVSQQTKNGKTKPVAQTKTQQREIGSKTFFCFIVLDMGNLKRIYYELTLVFVHFALAFIFYTSKSLLSIFVTPNLKPDEKLTKQIEFLVYMCTIRI